MHLSVCKIKSKWCLFVKNLFINVANAACTGQNAYTAVTLPMYRCSFAKIYITVGVQLKMKYHGTKYQTSGL